VDGRNPVNSPVEGKVVYPIINRVLYIPGGCLGLLPSTVGHSIQRFYAETLLDLGLPASVLKNQGRDVEFPLPL